MPALENSRTKIMTKLPTKPLTLSEITQEHVDLLNQLLTGMIPAFGLSPDQKRDTLRRISVDRAAELSTDWIKYLSDGKPKTEWADADMQTAETFFMMIMQFGQSARLWMNELQAVQNARRGFQPQNGHKITKVGPKLTKTTENKSAKAGRPRITGDSKLERQQTKFVETLRQMKVSPTAKMLQDSFPGISAERVAALLGSAR